MSEQDPFSFQPLPTPEDHVNEAFARLNLQRHDASTFHAFLVAALTPDQPVTRANEESFNAETRNKLTPIINSIAFARSKCRPHFEFPQDLPEVFFIVSAMMTLPNHGYNRMSTLMTSPVHATPMVLAHRSFMTLRKVDMEISKKGRDRLTIPPNLYESLNRSEKLLLEMRATHIGRDAIHAIDRKADDDALCAAFADVAKIRPLMTNTDSAMVQYFQAIDRRIAAHIETHGAPVPSESFGSRLRAHAREPDPPAAPAAETGNQPPEGSGKVVVVAFGRTKSGSGPQVV